MFLGVVSKEVNKMSLFLGYNWLYYAMCLIIVINFASLKHSMM